MVMQITLNHRSVCIRVAVCVLSILSILGGIYLSSSTGLLGVYASNTPPPAPTQGPTLLIHGFAMPTAYNDVIDQPSIDHRTSTDCKSYWSQTPSYLHTHTNTQVLTIGYYSDDVCDINISTYTQKPYISCIALKHSGGTKDPANVNNEAPIKFLACEFAWYIHNTYTLNNQYVNIVAHSMGGLITRYAIYGTHAQLTYFPTSIYVHNVVDLETPNGGAAYSQEFQFIYHAFNLNLGIQWLSNYEHEVQEMVPGSPLLQELFKNAQSPQGTDGTHWTLLGMNHYTTCNNTVDVVAADSAVFMNGADLVVYETPCYHHLVKGLPSPGNLDMMNDSSNKRDAKAYSCLQCHIKNGIYFWRSWSPSKTFPHSLQYVLNSLNYNPVSPTPSPSPTLSPSPTFTPSPTVTLTPTPSPASSVALSSTTAISSNDIWAVGTIWYGNQINPLIEHWNGNQWSVIPSPKVSDGQLASVSAVSANDIWAVGYIDYTTLIEHWDGNQWSVISSPNSSTISLISVAALSANDIWAVGCSSGYTPQVEHWDGSQWNLVSSPNPNGTSSCFNGMVAVSPSNIWATGFSNRATLVEHWDGSQWSIVPSPNSPVNPNMSNRLTSVAAVSADDIWAVGPTDGVSLIEHWDGSQWSVVNSPNGQTYTELLRVAAISANDVIAVGDTSFVSSNSVTYTPLIEQWNGKQWNIVPGPNFNMSVRINSVAVISSTDIWAVGSGSTTSAIAHWDGKQWSVVPGPV